MIFTRSRTLDDIARLKKTLHAKAASLQKTKVAEPKKRLIREKQALRKSAHDLRLAKEAFENQVQARAMHSCRSLCEAVHLKLPQELRDIVTRYLINDANATFFRGRGGKLKFANGTTDLQPYFDEDYTGTGLH